MEVIRRAEGGFCFVNYCSVFVSGPNRRRLSRATSKALRQRVISATHSLAGCSWKLGGAFGSFACCKSEAYRRVERGDSSVIVRPGPVWRVPVWELLSNRHVGNRSR
jgi:hypothetical protein